MQSCMKKTGSLRKPKRVSFNLPTNKKNNSLPCLSSKDDSPILWEELIINNWTKYCHKSEIELRELVNELEFKEHFWFKVNQHIFRRNKMMKTFGKIFTEKQIEVLNRIGSLYREQDKKGDLIEFFMNNPEIIKYFPNQVKTIVLLNTETNISRCFRNSAMVIKLKFIDACYKAIDGNLKNQEIERKDFYKRLIVSANKHASDMLNGIKNILFSGSIYPQGNFNPESGCYFYAIYEEIVKQAEKRVRHIEILERMGHCF